MTDRRRQSCSPRDDQAHRVTSLKPARPSHAPPVGRPATGLGGSGRSRRPDHRTGSPGGELELRYFASLHLSPDHAVALWEAIAADEWDRVREFLAPDFRHRIDKQLNFGDFDVDGFIANLRIWKELAGSVEEDIGNVLAVTDGAVVYRRDIHAVSQPGLESTWSALVVAVAQGHQLTHLKEFEPEDVARAMARFDELTH